MVWCASLSGSAVRVILDVDTGVDDALAIALAVCDPRVQLDAVVAVAGNVGLERTTSNSLKVLDWLGATRVPVYMAPTRPSPDPCVRPATGTRRMVWVAPACRRARAFLSPTVWAISARGCSPNRAGSRWCALDR